MIAATSPPYSAGSPSRLGNTTSAESAARLSSGSAPSIGVSKMPGAIVITRIPAGARARRAGLGRGGGDLADLAVERGDRRGVDDHAALAVVERLGLHDRCRGQPH